MLILHDLDGRPYYEAINYLSDGDVDYYESSVMKLFIRGVIKKQSVRHLLKKFVKNLIFRFKVPIISGKHIIIGMAPYDFRILWYGLLARKNRVVLHTSWPYWGGRKYPRKYGPLDFILKKIWINFINSRNVNIVAVSSSARDSIQNFSGNKKHVFLVPHVVNHNFFFPRADSRIEAHPFKRKTKILFVGKLIPEKGIKSLIEIFYNLSEENFEFTIVGDGDPELRNLVQNYNRNNLTYLGWVSDKQKLSEVYRSHDILLVPSQSTKRWEELFGLVITEAMTCGMVVLASDHVGPRTIIEHGQNGFVLDEEDLNIWLETLKELHIQSDRMARMKVCATESSEKYDLERVTTEWNKVLNSFNEVA